MEDQTTKIRRIKISETDIRGFLADRDIETPENVAIFVIDQDGKRLYVTEMRPIIVEWNE